MQKTIYQLLLSLFLLILVTPSSLAQEADSLFFGKIKDVHFSIEMSEDWTTLNNNYIKEIESIVRYTERSEGNIMPTINFIKFSIEELGISKEAFFAISNAELMMMFPDATLEERTGIVFLDDMALQFQIRTIQEGVPVQMMVIIYIEDDAAFNFTYIAEIEEFDSYKEEAKNIISSIEFVAEADVPKTIQKDTADILIFDDLYFFTKAEENHFSFFKENNGKDIKEAFNLLFAIGNTDFNQAKQCEEKFFAFLEDIAQDIPPKKRQKKTEEIFDLLHAEFLGEYQENVMFYEVFENETYNCVTASALFAIAFEYLNIPYVIKEIPTHVYLIAYPDDDLIILETTNALGFLPTNKTQMKKRRRFLRNNGFISDEAGRFMDAEQIYEEEYSGDRDITLTQLFGLLYCNHSIFKSDSMYFDEALIEVEKAYELYESPTILEWKQSLNYILCDKEVGHLSTNQLCIMADKVYQSTSNLLISDDEYLAFYEYFLLSIDETQEISNAEDFTECVAARIDNEALINSLNDKRQLLLVEKKIFAGETETALSILKENPKMDNEKFEPVLQLCVMQYLSELEMTELVFGEIETLKNDFPQIANLEWVKDFDAYSSLYLAMLKYDQNEPVKGQQYLDRFLELDVPVTFSEGHVELIDETFASASAYYVRKENYSKAEDYLKQGLSINPKSRVLNRKLNVLLDFWKR